MIHFYLTLVITLFWLKVAGLPSSGFDVTIPSQHSITVTNYCSLLVNVLNIVNKWSPVVSVTVYFIC